MVGVKSYGGPLWYTRSWTRWAHGLIQQGSSYVILVAWLSLAGILWGREQKICILMHAKLIVHPPPQKKELGGCCTGWEVVVLFPPFWSWTERFLVISKGGIPHFFLPKRRGYVWSGKTGVKASSENVLPLASMIDGKLKNRENLHHSLSNLVAFG